MGKSFKYWYMIYIDYCPVCAHDDTYRVRMYTERPERWEDRHTMKEVWDYCGVL